MANTVIKQDHEGHKYRLPAELVEQFNVLLSGYEVPRGTDAWYDADDKFNDAFYQYMIG